MGTIDSNIKYKVFIWKTSKVWEENWEEFNHRTMNIWWSKKSYYKFETIIENKKISIQVKKNKILFLNSHYWISIKEHHNNM